MKHKKLTIALVASMVATILMVATLSVYAYFTTRVYVYTEDGKEVAHVGMNLQLLFGKLSGVTEGTDLMIPSYNVVDANGNVVTVTENNATYWANVAGTGQYLHYNDGVNDKTTYDPDAPWGSAQNPYIISETRHLQNLSALQSVGYFDLLYVANNFDANGNYIPGSASIPYFLICTDTTSATTGAVAGTPVTIDGSALDSPIKPIGSAEHPFIGVIGGAFVNTKTETNSNDNTTTTVQLTTNVAGKTSSVSTIHGFKIQTNTNQTDVGLFGYVGYLGDEPKPTVGENDEVIPAAKEFEGVLSVAQDLLLSNVQVVVNNPTLPEVISELLGHVFTNHNFTYSSAAADASVPHEDHHIGIFAGHVSYAHVEYISVYYSQDDICAIDLTHTDTAGNNNKVANYHSSTGIVGFMHNMNSTVKNQSTVTTANGQTTTTYNGHLKISVGGISSNSVNMTPNTPGAGGGKEIGLGRGYVVAKTLYEGCHYIQANQGLYDRIWKYTVNVNNTPATYYGPMFYATTSGTTTTYKSQNGGEVIIADNGVATDKGTNKSSSVYAIRTDAGDGLYTYTLYHVVDNKQTGITSFTPDSKNCVELPMSIWQYVETIPSDAQGTLIWDQSVWIEQGLLIDAVLLTKKDSGYILTDTWFENEFPVTVVPVTDNAGNITSYKATIDGATYSDGNPVTINRVFFKLDDNTYSITPDTAKVPEWFQEKPLLIKDATTMQGTKLSMLSNYSNVPGSYFYDGVFTFALSTEQDTIESTWENETPDRIVLGPNVDNTWVNDPYKGYYGVVAYIKPITTKTEFDAVVASGEKIFIGHYSDDNNDGQWYGDSLSVMTLLETDLTDSDLKKLDDNFYSTKSNNKQFYSQAERDEIIQLMRDYQNSVEGTTFSMQYVDDQYKDDFNALISGVDSGNIQVLNLQSATNITDLINKYTISVASSDTANEYYFYQKNCYLSILQCVQTLSNVHLGDSTYYDILEGLVESAARQMLDNTYSLYPVENNVINLNPDPVTITVTKDQLDFSGYNNFIAGIIKALMPDKVELQISYSYDYDSSAVMYFDPDTGAFLNQISYTYGTETRYVNYNVGETWFDGVENNPTDIYLYTIEAMSTVEAGQFVFIPDEDVVSSDQIQDLPADGYVLWPQAIMKTDGTYNGFDDLSENGVSSQLINANINATATKTDPTAGDAASDVYRTYKLLSLEALYSGDSGWQDGTNTPLSNVNLRKKFAMQQGIGFGLSLHIPGISDIQLNNNSIFAPIGKGGALADIPKGSVTFRINETTEKGSHIYVIVSVPVSNFCDGSSEESLTNANDYYLGLWQTQGEDTSVYTTFDQTTALQKFELPRSRPYELGTDADDQDYILVQYGKDEDNNPITYRCYLNGDRVLVAYRFTVKEAGTYFLGTAVGQSNFGDSNYYNYPMEIVYCAADGTASAGNDGTSGSVIGSMDYVYDNGTQIIHVQDYAEGAGPTQANDYANYYYNSHIITYTDNEASGFPNINDLRIFPYRYIDDTKKVVLQLGTEGTNTGLFIGKHSGVETDTVTSNPPGTIANANQGGTEPNPETPTT